MKKGPKPTNPNLKLVAGTFRQDRHGDAEEAAKNAERSARGFGPLVKPKNLRGEAGRAWKNFIEPAWWLDGSRQAAAIAFVRLWEEFMSAPARFQSARHSQMRAYMNELGLTDERNRMGRAGGSTGDGDDFFD